VSLGALLSGQVPSDLIRDRVVFIGAGAESLRDQFATPFAPDVLGVEVLATLAANLIEGRLIRSGDALWIEALAIALAAVVLAGLAAAIPNSPLVGALATIAVWTAAAGTLQVAFNAGLAIDATSVLGAMGIASAAFWLGRLRSDQIGAQRLEAERGMLSRFLSPFANRTLPQHGVTPVWRTEVATIGFVDLEGSVGLAEGQSPGETATLLGEVQSLIASAAARHGGAVVERFGDGALVAFGFGGGTAADAIAFARGPGRGPDGRAAAAHQFALRSGGSGRYRRRGLGPCHGCRRYGQYRRAAAGYREAGQGERRARPSGA
jgi:adenylate cyclase